MRVLVAYASKAGSTKEMAEFIAERLRRRGLSADAMDVAAVKDPVSYDAFVVGSALYMFHWMKEARQFVSRNKKLLWARPVWLFSSGPVGTSRTNKEGRDLLDASVSGPKEIEELRESVNLKDHRIFFGVLDGSRLTGMTGMTYRLVRRSESARESMPEGDFRDWNEIGSWADGIADALAP